MEGEGEARGPHDRGKVEVQEANRLIGRAAGVAGGWEWARDAEREARGGLAGRGLYLAKQRRRGDMDVSQINECAEDVEDRRATIGHRLE